MQILMPALAQGHFVLYVMNLKKGRYEYLSSKKMYPLEGIIRELGDRLMNEARSYVDYMYHKLSDECPYNWEEWDWYVAEVFYQSDSNSCGVFVIKFLEEWDEDEESMPSFKDWSTKTKFLIGKGINQYRMEMCLRILKLFTNTIRVDVQKKANDFLRKR
ncbi:hypothetical protein LIER_42454 [Lithospermum erythrorhizon]|uniref:Ubiquitin-like protease family profile domain-containing protein n=1 Tax=Lithospermum erythrorhizon TaxID=34254 RepID=A0AAV3RPX6_LITER